MFLVGAGFCSQLAQAVTTGWPPQAGFAHTPAANPMNFRDILLFGYTFGAFLDKFLVVICK
ncbi:MAG: hypothetical protein ACI9ZF_001745 [Bradyrhizobium sp.]